jgi:hypothetical protein
MTTQYGSKNLMLQQWAQNIRHIKLSAVLGTHSMSLSPRCISHVKLREAKLSKTLQKICLRFGTSTSKTWLKASNFTMMS